MFGLRTCTWHGRSCCSTPLMQISVMLISAPMLTPILRMNRIPRLVALLVASLVLLVQPVRAAEPTQLPTYAKSLDKYVDEYTGAAMKDPSNKGARRLQVKLTNLQSDLAAYRKGQLDRKFLEGRLKEALTESKRYNSTTAKKLTALLENIQALLPNMASRMNESGDSKTTASKDKPAAKKPSKGSNDLEDAPAEEVLRGRALSADEIEAAAANGDPEEATDDAAAEAATDENGIPSASVGTGTAAKGQGSGVLIGLGMLLVVGVFGAVAYVQHKSVQTLKGQLTQARMHGGDGGAATAELVARVAQQEQQLNMVLQRNDSRIAGLEDSIHKLTLALSQQAARPAAPDVDFRAQDAYKSYAQPAPQPYAQAQAYAASATQAATSGAAVLHTSEEKAIVLETLRGLAGSTLIPQLSEIAKRVMPHFEPGATSEATGAEVASLLQFAYLSATLENQVDPYQHLVSYYRKEHVVVEDKMQGRMAFSEAYAENIGYDEFKRVAGNTNAEGPDFRRIIETVEGSSLLRDSVKNTILYTRWPTVLRQKDGVKTVLQKGRYIVKN